MSLIVLAPAPLAVVVPEAARRMLRLPNLEALVAAGTAAIIDCSIECWLGARLGLPADEEPPIAALRMAADLEGRSPAAPAGERAANAQSGYWLCADPVAATMGVDSVRIDQPVTDLSPAQSGAIVLSLDRFFAPDGLRLVATGASRWYVHCERTQQMTTTPLWRALGGSMLHQMPDGVDAPAWRTRLNDAQMLLHAHPVNAAREADGLPPVASVWWWGGGSWPPFAPADIDAVAGGPRWVGAACRANGVAYGSDVPDPQSVPADSTLRRLIILDAEWEQSGPAAEALVRWDAGWFAALRAALDGGRQSAATLVFPWGGRVLRVHVAGSGASRWRRWFGSLRRDPPPALAESLKAFQD